MVDSCIPPISSSVQHTHDHGSNNSEPDETVYDKERFSAKTVARAMQLSRRAEDLGMPLHRPLYRRLAMSVVLTSAPQLYDDLDSAIDDATPLVLPGELQQRKEGMHPPIATELVDLCIRARSALRIPSPIFSIERDPLEVFAAEILTKPLLLLLKQKQWEEAFGLLQGWREHFGRSEKIILLDMLGEVATLEALEIAKSWVVDDEFGKDAQACRHALELTNLLQDSLELILDGKVVCHASCPTSFINWIHPLTETSLIPMRQIRSLKKTLTVTMMTIGINQVHVKVILHATLPMILSLWNLSQKTAIPILK